MPDTLTGLRVFRAPRGAAFSYRPEGLAVFGAGTVCRKSLQMPFGAVSFVSLKSVGRVGFREIFHHVVAGDLGDNARGRDGETAPVPFDDGPVLTGKALYGKAVHQGELRGPG